jgi:putative addiction module component (TIGR02574 family)
MGQSVPQLFDAALALDEDDRAALVARLVESLDGPVDTDAESAWAAEISRRLERIGADTARSIPMDEAVARLHRAARRR